MPRKPIATKPKAPSLTALLTYWQHHLKLDDWRIRIDWEPRLDINIRGRCFWEGSNEDAMILINPHGVWTEDYPIERTIIHELLHLIFAKGGDPCPEYIEDAVIHLTMIMWENRKEKTHAP